MKVIKQLLEVEVAFVHGMIAFWFYGTQTHCLRVMNDSFCQIDECWYGTCWYGTTQVQQRMYLYIAFVIIQASSWIKLKAQLDSTAIKSVHNTIHVKTGKLISVKFPCQAIRI